MKKIEDKDRFKLVYMDADVEFCKKNDKYGLYEKADEGTLKHLAGVDEVYDVPEKSES